VAFSFLQPAQWHRQPEAADSQLHPGPQPQAEGVADSAALQPQVQPRPGHWVQEQRGWASARAWA